MYMIKYVALLRGINVGGNCKVEMKKLKEALLREGSTTHSDIGTKTGTKAGSRTSVGVTSGIFQNVSTYINSGNVIFDSIEKDERALTTLIESILHKTFGFKIPVVLRSLAQIKKVAQAIPAEWTNNTEQKTDILFLWEHYCNKKTLTLIKQTEGVDNLIYVSGAVIWNVDRKYYAKSGMNKFVGSEVYKHMTARNVNTVRKLLDLMSA
jgi:uncharacterized protein (DUF1697 family)